MISFALALIIVLVLVACGDNPASNGGNTQNETVTLRASTPTAPEHPWSKCLDNIAAQIKEKTNGFILSYFFVKFIDKNFYIFSGFQCFHNLKFTENEQNYL